jgi:hypothetical protein
VGLWQQIKSGRIACEEAKPTAGATGEIGSFSTADREQLNVAAGKALIARAVRQIAELWNEVETSGGSRAWGWIFNGSHHGALIRQAKDRVNAVGSRGKREALESASAAWLAAWRKGILDWDSSERKQNQI